MMKRITTEMLFFSALILVFSFFNSGEAFADDCVWTAAADNDFSNPGNWDACATNGYPQAGDSVILDVTSIDDLNIDTTVNVVDFEIASGYDGTVSAALTQSMTVNDEFIIADADAEFDATNINLIIDGSSITAAFNFDAGTFTAPDGSHTFETTGGWDFENGAIFNHNNGTIEVSGALATTVWDYINNDLNLNNLTIDVGDGNVFRLGSGVDLDIHVAGDLILNEGIVDGRSTSADGNLYADGTLTWESTFDGGDGRMVFNMTSPSFTLPSDLDDAKYATNGCFTMVVGDTNNVTVNTGSSNTFVCMRELEVNTGSVFDNRNFDADFTIVGGTLGILIMDGGTFYTGGAEVTIEGTANINSGSMVVGEGNDGSVNFESFLIFNGGTLDASASAGLVSTFGNTTAAVDINSGTLISTPGVFEVTGGWDHDGGTFTHSNGTVEFTGTLANVFTDLPASPNDFYNLRFEKADSTDTVTLRNGTSDTYNVLNDFEIIKGTVNTNDGATINLGGDWTLCPSSTDADCSGASPGDATFVPGIRTVTLNGTDQSIHGSTTFNNLTKNVSSAATLTFEEGERQTISGTMNLQGQSGELLSLRSSTDGMETEIDPQGTRTLNYLDVKDNNNVNAASISVAGTNSVDGGNNTNWDFVDTVIINSVTLTLEDDADSNGGINIGDTIRLEVDVSNVDGACDDPSGTTVTADFTTYGGGASQSVTCVTPNAGVNDILRVDVVISDAGGAGIDLGSNDPASRVTITATDFNEPNTTAISNALVQTVDTVAPATVSNLSTSTSSSNSVTINWTAIAGDFNTYEVYYSKTPGVTNLNGTPWTSANDAALDIITTSSTKVTGLEENSTYYFTIYSVDESDNRSVVSAELTASTSAGGSGGGVPLLGSGGVDDEEVTVEGGDGVFEGDGGENGGGMMVDKEDLGFIDTIGHWGEELIEELRVLGIVNGRRPRYYEPDNDITFAELLKMSYESFGVETGGDNYDHWSGQYLQKAEETRLLDVFPETSLNYVNFNHEVQRIEGLRIILQISGRELGENQGLKFPDTKLDEWYSEYLSYAIEEGIVIGFEDTLFRPNKNLTRAEAAKMIYETR